MMNKLKTGKAWHWKVAIFLPMLALLLMAFGKPEYVVKNVAIAQPENIVLNKDLPKSQDSVVNGKVTFPDGKPLQKVVVRIKGTDKIAQTDKDGKFKLENVPKEAVLEFFTQGLNSRVVKADFANSMNVKLEPGYFYLERVKVVGLVSDQTPPKSLPKIRFIRQTNSANSPLYIVDGIVANSTVKAELEPDDVEKVNILGGKKAIDKYGENAKNGAMEITRKKKVNFPAENNKVNVEVDAFGKNQAMELPAKSNIFDERPEFMGGMKGLMKFIANNIQYPDQPKNDKVQANVDVRFVINKSGKVEKVKVAKEGNPAFDAEAIRVISSMPDWTPGKKDGKSVEVPFNIPIQFSLK